MRKIDIAVIAPVLALKPKKSKPVKAAKPKAAKPKTVGEMNTDALQAPHAVKGKPHHYQYK